MTWRYFDHETLVEGLLFHTLDCGHQVTGTMTKGGDPVRRQWCPTCWKANPRYQAPSTLVTLKLDGEDARWLRAILSSGLSRKDFTQEPRATRVLATVEKALGD